MQHVRHRPCDSSVCSFRNPPRAPLTVCQAKRGHQLPPPDPPSAEPITSRKVRRVKKGAATPEQPGLAPLSRHQAAKAQQLGLTPKRFRAKLKELLQLMPGVEESTLLSLEPDDLQDMMADTGAVANRLVQARIRLPRGMRQEMGQRPGETTPAPHFLMQHPELLSSRHWRSFSNSLPVASLVGHTGGVAAVAITPDGRQAVSGGDDQVVRVWDLQAHICTATLQAHTSPVWALALTPGGRLAVSAGFDGELCLFDLRTHACVATTRVGNLSTRAVAITPDGQGAVTGGVLETSLQVCSLEPLARLNTLEDEEVGKGLGRGVECVALSPDGRYAVAGTWDTTLWVWDLQAGSRVARLQGHRSGVLAVAVSGDGRQAVSGSVDETLRVWDLQAQTCTATLPGHVGSVWAVAIAPDGRHVVSGGADGTLRVWDLQALACVATLRGHTQRVKSVAITPDGRHAVSGSGDQTLHVWDLQPHTDRGSSTSPPAP